MTKRKVRRTLFGLPIPTAKQHEKAIKIMDPFLADFQKAGDKQMAQDFGTESTEEWTAKAAAHIRSELEVQIRMTADGEPTTRLKSGLHEYGFEAKVLTTEERIAAIIASHAELCVMPRDVLVSLVGNDTAKQELLAAWDHENELRRNAEDKLEPLVALLALNLKVDEWDPPLVDWLKTPEDAMRAMTLNMAKSRDELKHQNRTLVAHLADLETKHRVAVGKHLNLSNAYDALVVLLKESRREHYTMCNARPKMRADGSYRAQNDDELDNWRPLPTGPCNCGADTWNARVDAVLT